LLGGRNGHGAASELADDTLVDVWELELKGRNLKKVKAVCCGCGEYGVGRQLCSGTCGGGGGSVWAGVFEEGVEGGA
jgi:hypothetical protein